MSARETAEVPRRVLPLLVLSYAAFYICRANVEPGLSLLANDYGYDKEQIGAVMGVAIATYALGKIVLGPLADLLGGKRVLIASLFATAAVSFAIAASNAPSRFGPAIGLVVIGALVGANRFVQAGGWGSVVNVVGVTFGASRRGTIMGILSTSYEVGNVLALLLCAALTHAGFGWRGLFVVNPLIVVAVALLVRAALPAPQEAVVAAPANAPSQDAPRLGDILRRLASHPSFWFAAGMSLLLTFVRTAFMSWTPRFLYEVSVAAHVGSPISSSIAKSAFFGVFGIIGAVATGRLSDRLGPGRRTVVITTSLALLFTCTLVLGHAGVSSPAVATAGVAACGLFLLGPYSLLSGAISLDIAGASGAATAASIIDAVGYAFGGTLATFALGSVSKRAGWTAAFDLVAAATFFALVLAAIWTRRRF
jgi:sugar phosphate permease